MLLVNWLIIQSEMCICIIVGEPDSSTPSCIWWTCVRCVVPCLEPRQSVHHSVWSWRVLWTLGVECWGRVSLLIYVCLFLCLSV